ncbi:hypothetical protein TNCV_2955221 [Trichonephila clavipes]|nr:hypothetical protein TNCV_2955221 [Trichonephila clavipes]
MGLAMLRAGFSRCPGLLKTRLLLSSGHYWKQDSSLNTIRPTLIEAGTTAIGLDGVQTCCQEFDIAHSVVSRLWKSLKTTGMCSRRHGGEVVLEVRRLQKTDISSYQQKEPAHHSSADESRFSLSSDCRRQLIWRESGTAYRPENIQEKDRYPTCSIMVWAGIMINGRTRLHVVANGTMTGQRYIDEVLLPHVRLFRGAVGDKFVFMDDNATCHRTLAVQGCLDSEGIQRLV